MSDHDDTTRYRLELDMLERDATLGNRRAVALLRSELALALNAAHFMALSAGDIRIGEIWRSISQEGVARYTVELLLDERAPSISQAQAAALLQRELARAQNASHFIRIAAQDIDARLAAREPASPHASLRAA